MEEVIHDAKRLSELQALPLERKILISQTRIIEWNQHWKGNVCVSFSGGKDSTVLLNLVHKINPDVPAVFSNTGLEYPEIQKFSRENNAVFLTPKMRFNEVINVYGYPLIGKEVAGFISYARKPCIDGAEDAEAIRRARNTFLHYAKENDIRTPIKTQTFDGTQIDLDENDTIYNSKFRSKVKLDMFTHEKWLLLAQEIPAKISNHCCYIMKKSPMRTYFAENKVFPFIGTLATESRLRKYAWIKNGCNSFSGRYQSSQPLSFWTEQDILAYIVQNNLKIASVYGDIVSVDPYGMKYSPTDSFGNVRPRLKCTGCSRTGCIFCGFGLHSTLDKETSFQRLAKTHPRQYEYCIGGGKWIQNPDYDPFMPKYDGEWKNWNPKELWVPSEKGLGMGALFDMVNDIYGKDFYRYR